LHLDTKNHYEHGYILPSLVGLLSLLSLATISAFNRSATDIHILQAERNMAHTFALAENHLIIAEQALLDGTLRDDLVQIETFQPKGFRKRPGIETTHYKLSSRAHQHQAHINIQLTLRVHEKTSPDKNSSTPRPTHTPASAPTSALTPNKTLERVSWQIM
jgi:hypothetical protein